MFSVDVMPRIEQDYLLMENEIIFTRLSQLLVAEWSVSLLN